MIHLLSNPWFLLIVMALIALFFIARSAVQIKKIDRLRSQLDRDQEKIQRDLSTLMEVDDDDA